jgi:acyl carrier protein
MQNREETLQFIKQMMLEMFEIEEGLVCPNARLYEDLDFDSIDAVDMIVKLKEVTGKAVKVDDFKSARTINDVVEAVYQLINN